MRGTTIDWDAIDPPIPRVEIHARYGPEFIARVVAACPSTIKPEARQIEAENLAICLRERDTLDHVVKHVPSVSYKLRELAHKYTTRASQICRQLGLVELPKAGAAPLGPLSF